MTAITLVQRLEFWRRVGNIAAFRHRWKTAAFCQRRMKRLVRAY